MGGVGLGEGRGQREHLPGVWKLSRRSSTGSVGWCSGSSLLLGRLPFRASDSALFLQQSEGGAVKAGIDEPG